MNTRTEAHEYPYGSMKHLYGSVKHLYVSLLIIPLGIPKKEIINNDAYSVRRVRMMVTLDTSYIN